MKKNELVVISTENKQLPFPNAKNVEQKFVKDFQEFAKILEEEVGNPDRKCIVIDSFTRILDLITSYLEDVKKISGYGFWKYYAKFIRKMLMKSMQTNKWLIWIAIDDTQFNSDGEEVITVKVQGKELKGLIESFFTIVLFTHVDGKQPVEKRYQFCTNSDGKHTAKTPLSMFKNQYVPNDIVEIFNVISKYYDFDVNNYETKRPNILIVGRSGSGKSTSLRNIIK